MAHHEKRNTALLSFLLFNVNAYSVIMHCRQMKLFQLSQSDAGLI